MNTLRTHARIAVLLLLSAAIVQGAHTFQFNTPGQNLKIAVAWQGGTTTVSNVFSGVMPDGLALWFWNTNSQQWNGINFEFGEWSNPDYEITPGQGFLISTPNGETLTMEGPDTPGTVINYSLEADKWYLIGSSFPKTGLLEIAQYNYQRECTHLNYPGLLDSENNGYPDTYYIWQVTEQDWEFVQRADDDPTYDRNNPTGGWDEEGVFGARWRPPGSTSGYQPNGHGDNTIFEGEAIMVRSRVDRVWVMYKEDDPVCQ